MVRKLHLLVALVLLAACQRTTDNIDNREGVVKLRVLTDSLNIVVSKSTPGLSDLRIRLENTRAENLREWDSPSDLPSEIRMVPGSYRFVAWYGQDDVFPSWDAMYWQGEYKFKIEADDILEVPLSVKVGVAQVKVNFDVASFDKFYTDYTADIRTTTPKTPDADFLTFTPLDQESVGRFLPGTLRMRLHLRSKLDGKVYEFSPTKPLGSAKAAEFYNVELKVTSVNGDATLNVITNGEVTEIPMDLLLPGSILPKAPPKLRSVGFDYTTQGLIYSQGNAPKDKRSAALETPGGVKSLKIIPTGAALKRLWNNIPMVDIVGINQEQREMLNRSGFTWSEALSDPITAEKIISRAEVRFDQLFFNQRCAVQDALIGSDYSFEIQVQDMFEQTNTTASTFLVEAKINAPVFSMVAPVAANAWAKTADLKVNFEANIEGEIPYIEVYKNGQWERAIQDVHHTDFMTKDYTILNLNPDTEYKFRAAFGEHRSSTEYTLRTETVQPIINGDMESWQAEMLPTKYSQIPYYRPWVSNQGQYWITNNDKSTAHRTDGFFGTTYGYNCFPTVSYTKSANSGNFAAEIRTTSAVNGNTITIAYEKIAGLLYIGDYSYQESNQIITEGKAHNSRPVGFKFQYTYENYNSDSFDARITLWNGTTKIGEGKFTSKNGESVTQYKEAQVGITYTNRVLKADRMTIVMRSTTKDSPEVRARDLDVDFVGNEDYNKGWNVHVGSILRVDDIELVY